MIIIDAVNLIINVNCEWNSVKTFITYAASEASRMIRLAHGMKNLKENDFYNGLLKSCYQQIITISMIK